MLTCIPFQWALCLTTDFRLHIFPRNFQNLFRKVIFKTAFSRRFSLLLNRKHSCCLLKAKILNITLKKHMQRTVGARFDLIPIIQPEIILILLLSKNGHTVSHAMSDVPALDVLHFLKFIPKGTQRTNK